MIQTDDIQKVIFQAIDDVNRTLPPDKRIPLSEETPLIGTESPVDSLTLTVLIVGIEQKVEETFAKSIALVDHSTMSETQSPLRGINLLCEHIRQLLEN